MSQIRDKLRNASRKRATVVAKTLNDALQVVNLLGDVHISCRIDLLQTALSSISHETDIMLFVCDDFSRETEESIRIITSSVSKPTLLVVSSKNPDEKATAFEFGANDCIVSPWEDIEILFRIMKIFDLGNDKCVEKNSVKNEFFVYSLDSGDMSFRDNLGQRIFLTTVEFKILDCLIKKKNKIVRRTDLTNYVYGKDHTVSKRAVDVVISRLRKKLIDFGCEPTMLRTLRGEGYTLDLINIESI